MGRALAGCSLSGLSWFISVSALTLGALGLGTLPVTAKAQTTLGDDLAAVRQTTWVPALAGLVYQDGHVREEAAVGVRKVGDPTPVLVGDAFHLGSDTKAMTATLVAMFVERGRLAWTSPLGEVLPDIDTMHPSYRDVTVEMLLAHRSGLGDESTFDHGRLFARLREPGLDPRDGRTSFARAMLSAAPASPPGSAFAYSNANYVVLGRILERISGRSWEDLMRGMLFAPLAMDSCGFGALGEPAARVAAEPWAHSATAGRMEPVVLDNPATLGPAGTVHCSLRDWMKFVALHLNAFAGRPVLLDAASFAKLHAAWPGQEYTCGGWLRTERAWAGGPVFTHDGSNTLNYATVWWAPKKDTAAMAATNVGMPAGQAAAQAAIGVLLKRAGLL